MLRLSTSIFLLAAAGPALLAENDLPGLVAKLETAANPFAAPAGASDNGLQGVFEVLSAVSSPLFTPGDPGTGTVMFEGQPWKTGETRVVGVGGGKLQILFKSLQAPAGETPGAAGFALADSQQEISIDLPALPAGLAELPAAAGWLVGPRTVITPGELPGGPVNVHWQGTECPGRAVSRSSDNGLTLVLLDRPVPMAFATAEPGAAETVQVLTGDGRNLTAPAALLTTAPGPRLVGAIVLTRDGRVLGILGLKGLVAAKNLHLANPDSPPDGPHPAPPLVTVTPGRQTTSLGSP